MLISSDAKKMWTEAKTCACANSIKEILLSLSALLANYRSQLVSEEKN
jgi:hypothetical protein